MPEKSLRPPFFQSKKSLRPPFFLVEKKSLPPFFSEEKSSLPYFQLKKIFSHLISSKNLFLSPIPTLNTVMKITFCIYCMHHKPMNTPELLDPTQINFYLQKLLFFKKLILEFSKFLVKKSLRLPPYFFSKKKSSPPFLFEKNLFAPLIFFKNKSLLP